MKQPDADKSVQSHNCLSSSLAGNRCIYPAKSKPAAAGGFLLTVLIILAVLTTMLLAGLSWQVWRSYQSQEQIYGDGLRQTGTNLQRQTVDELDRNRRQAFLRVVLVFLVLPISLTAWFATVLMVKGRIVKHKHFENALQNKMQANQLLLDSMPCVALIVQSHSRTIMASNKLGINLGAIPGQHCFSTWMKRDSPCPWCLAEQVWSTGEPQHREFESLGINWEGYWVSVTKDLYLYYAFDISERKRAEVENERLNKTLEAENKELQNMMDMASHDLRSPLVNIQGFGSILGQACEQVQKTLENTTVDHPARQEAAPLLCDQIRNSLDFINSSADKMQMVLDGLLTVSRVGTAAVNIEPLDMNKMVRQILNTMEFQIEKGGASVTAEPLPGCMGDFSQINQVFSNLIDNAVKYLDPGRKGAIRISGRIEKDKAVYCVEDNGVGVADKDKDKVFEIFGHLKPDGPVVSEGLGLTIVSRILDRHNGKIWLESEPNKGSTFYVVLPAASENVQGGN